MSSWNTVPMRPLTTPKPFSPWIVAVLAYLVGTVVTLVLGFVIGTAGFLVMTGIALGGDPGEPTLDEIVNVTVLVAIVIGVISLAIQAWFIHRRGGARPVLVSLAARAATLLLGVAITPLALGGSLNTALGAGVEILVLALLIRPREAGPPVDESLPDFRNVPPQRVCSGRFFPLRVTGAERGATKRRLRLRGTHTQEKHG